MIITHIHIHFQCSMFNVHALSHILVFVFGVFCVDNIFSGFWKETEKKGGGEREGKRGKNIYIISNLFKYDCLVFLFSNFLMVYLFGLVWFVF